MNDSRQSPFAPPESEFQRLNERLKDRYRIEAMIGTGAVGAVYRAMDLRLNRQVAIKAIREGHHLAAKWRDRFHEEAQIIAKFAHSGIVQVHEIVEVDHRPLIVMEYVEGGDLEEAIRAGIERERLIGIMISVCEAVGYAHAHGIIHCDIKPRNIMLTNAGAAKIADFGIALRVDDEASRPGAPLDLRKKNIRGSPQFMSPEQAHGNLWQLSARTDVFGLGATLYYGLTRKRIYDGGVEEMLERARRCEIRRPSEVAEDIPPELDAICMKCMETEPAARYADAASLAEDLYRFLEGLPVSVRRYSVFQKTAGAIRYRPKAFALSVAVILSVAAGSIAAQSLDYHVARKTLVNVLREGVKGVAAATAFQVNPELVEAVRGPADEDQPACRALVRLLKDLKSRHPHVDYMYIARKADRPGYVRFVAMDSFEDPLGNLHPGDVYEETPKYPEMLAAFDGPTADRDVNRVDSWNVALSGYAPVRDGKGNAIAIVGVDLKNNEISLVFRQIDRAFMVLIGLFLIATPALLALILRWRIAFWEEAGHSAYGRSRLRGF